MLLLLLAVSTSYKGLLWEGVISLKEAFLRVSIEILTLIIHSKSRVVPLLLSFILVELYITILGLIFLVWQGIVVV